MGGRVRVLQLRTWLETQGETVATWGTRGTPLLFPRSKEGLGTRRKRTNYVCPSWALDEKSHAGLTKQDRVTRISPRNAKQKLQELPGHVGPQMTVMTLSCLCPPPKSYSCSKLNPSPQWKSQPTEEGAPSEEKRL